MTQPRPQTPPRNGNFPAHLALQQAPSRDGDESFISDITGDVLYQSVTPPRPLSPRSSSLQQQSQRPSVFKATSLLSGAANIYQTMIGSSARSHDEDDDESGALAHGNHDGNSFVTADQTANNKIFMPRISEDDAASQARLESQPSGFDFLKDSPQDMTYSRRIALHLMSRKWYYPKLERHPDDLSTMMEDTSDETEAALRREAYPFGITKREYPSLEKAWVCTYMLWCDMLLQSSG